jgi:hypothetical protein
MIAEAHTGRCACGNVRYRLDGPIRDACYCHCESCRRYVGAAFVAWGTVDAASFEIRSGKLAEYQSSPGVSRGFCDTCGTSLTYRNDGRALEIDVTLVTLDDPNSVVPDAHVWVQDKLDYVIIDDDLAQHMTDR